MTELLLQTKDRLLAAEIAYQKASDALNLAMTELETAKKNRSEAQKNFDSKTLNYSLAIQNAGYLEIQPYLSEASIIAANHNLDVAKKEYDAAQGINQEQETISQSAFYTVVQAQAVYDAAKLEFDSADYDYARILRERKLPLLGESDPPEQPETPPENIDFLMQFLKQTPLPDYEGAEDLIDEQVKSDIDDDASLPFERRPAIEKPDTISIQEDEQPTIKKSSTGHITWGFKIPNTPDNKNETEKTDDQRRTRTTHPN